MNPTIEALFRSHEYAARIFQDNLELFPDRSAADLKELERLRVEIYAAVVADHEARKEKS